MTSNASMMRRAVPAQYVFAVDVNIGGTWHADCHVIYVREIVKGIWVVFDPNMSEGDTTTFNIYRPAINIPRNRMLWDVVRRANIGDDTSKFVNACYKCLNQPNDSIPGIKKGVCFIAVIAFHHWLNQYLALAGSPVGMTSNNQQKYYQQYVFWVRSMQAAVGVYFRDLLEDNDNALVFFERYLPKGFEVPKKILADYYV